jgi:amidase
MGDPATLGSPEEPLQDAMSLSPYADAAAMSRALAAGETTSTALTEAAIARLEALDGGINAICVKTFARARAAAGVADAHLAKGERGPLLGVPMTVKESFNLAGTPTTWGFAGAAGFMPAEDALAVQRVERAGAVILGKTNVPLGLGDWQSYNTIYGVTHNPYDLARTPGGSSGGSSAALAAGFGALSLGSDIGGSLRVPAHFCGVYALKPTHDLCPMRGHTPPGFPPLPSSVDLSVIGPMARSAADLEALLDVIAGPDELDMGRGYRLQLPPARHASLADFRLLVLDRHPLVDTEACVAEAIETLAAGLARCGAQVARRSELLPDLVVGAETYIHLLSATFAARWPEDVFARILEAAGNLAPDDHSLAAEQVRGATLSFRAWSAASARRNGVRAQWRALFERFDAVIAPVTPTPAFAHDHEPDQGKRRMRVNGAEVDYFANVLWAGVATMPGLPAVALPIGRSPEGLPIGAQIIGPWLEDRTPLRLAQAIEREFGGFQPPGL